MAGSAEALGIIRENLCLLTYFYPKHIRREDNAFFVDIEKYFTKGEMDAVIFHILWTETGRFFHNILT